MYIYIYIYKYTHARARANARTHARIYLLRAHRFFLRRREAFALALDPRALVSLVFTLRLCCANTQLFLSLLLSLFPYSPSSSFHSIPLRGGSSVSLSPRFASFSLSLCFSDHPYPALSSVSSVGAQIKSLFLPSFRVRRALAPSPSQRLFLPLPRFLH